MYDKEPSPPLSVTETAPRARASVKYWLVPSSKSVVVWLPIEETVPVTTPEEKEELKKFKEKSLLGFIKHLFGY